MHRTNSIAFTLLLTVAAALLTTSAHAASPRRPVESLMETRHRNVVLQHWELSCAAAALATILRYQYGEPVTERSVALGLIDRADYIANPDLVRVRQGFSLLDLKRFVDRLGLEGVGLGRLELRDLIARAPLIVPVDLMGYPHFVVFRGATSNRVLVADPAFGNVTLSRERFLAGWIEYRSFGHVGFVVQRGGKPAPAGALTPHAKEFLSLR